MTTFRRDPYRPASADSVDQLARELAILRRSARRPQLTHSAIDDGQLVTTVAGQTTTIIGQQWDGTSGAVVIAGPTPPTPSAPGVTTQPNGITVRWDGTFPDQPGFQLPVVAPGDFKGVEVQVSPDPAFPEGNTAQAFDLVKGTLITSARGGDVFVPWGDGGTPLYARLVTRATSGKGSTPSAVTGPVTSGVSDDAIAPKAPGFLNLSPGTTMGKDGHEQGYITAQWVAPTENEDNTPLYDLAGYLVHWKITSGTAWQSTVTTDTSINLAAAPNQAHSVRVAAFDRRNNFSPWTATSSVTVTADTTPPAQPSVPAVTNYLGQLRIFWDGLLNGGTAPPVDFNRVDVHVSGTSGFTPVAGTLVSSLSTRGYAFATNPYGVDAYVKLVAYDNSGNASTASAQAVGTTSQVVDRDIFDGAVGTSKLADLVVTNAKINLLAVNDANIGNLNVGKLVSGTMNASVVLSGRFTTASTNARVEHNALGFQGFRSDGSKWLSLTNTEALITATIKTATSGRRVEMGVAGTAGVIDFYSPTGERQFVKGYTEPNGVDSIQAGSTIAGLANPHFLYGLTNWNKNGDINTHGRQLIFGTTDIFRVESYTDRTAYNAENPPATGSVYRLLLDSAGLVYRQSNNVGRLFLTGSATAIGDPSGFWRFDANVNDTIVRQSDNQIVGHHSNPSNSWVFWPDGDTTNKGSIRFWGGNGNVDQSAKLVWMQHDANGTMMKSVGGALEVRRPDDSAFANIFSANIVPSDGRGKDEVTDADVDALSVVRNELRARKYRRKTGKNADGTDALGPIEIGIVAQEAPSVIVSPHQGSDGTIGIDHYQFTTLLSKALQQAIARIETLEKRLPQNGKGSA